MLLWHRSFQVALQYGCVIVQLWKTNSKERESLKTCLSWPVFVWHFTDYWRKMKLRVPQRKFQILAIEIYKAKNDVTLELVDDIQFTKIHDFRNKSLLRREKGNTYFISESISSLTPRIWELVQEAINNGKLLTCIKKRIKLWTTDKCPSQICKRDIEQLGFIWVVPKYS